MFNQIDQKGYKSGHQMTTLVTNTNQNSADFEI